MFSSARQKWTSPDGQHIWKTNVSEQGDKQGTTDTKSHQEETALDNILPGLYYDHMTMWSSILF